MSDEAKVETRNMQQLPAEHTHRRAEDPVVIPGDWFGLKGLWGQIARGGIAGLFGIVVFLTFQHLLSNDDKAREQDSLWRNQVLNETTKQWMIVGGLKDAIVALQVEEHEIHRDIADLNRNLRDLIGESIKQGKAAASRAEAAEAAAKKAEMAMKELKEAKEKQ